MEVGKSVDRQFRAFEDIEQQLADQPRHGDAPGFPEAVEHRDQTRGDGGGVRGGSGVRVWGSEGGLPAREG